VRIAVRLGIALEGADRGLMDIPPH
jgi:hypothetical protein